MRDDRFRHAEETYRFLRGELDAGRLTPERFEAAMWDAAIEADGRWWMLGASSGRWYVSDGTTWTETEPGRDVGTPAAAVQPDAPVAALGTFAAHTGSAWAVGFSPDGRLAVTGGDTTVRLWDVATGQALRRFDGHSAEVFGAAFAPSGRHLLSCSRDHSMRIWDVGSGGELCRFTVRHSGIRATAFSPNGRLILAGCEDGTARVWDAAVGRELLALEHANQVWGVAFTPDGNHAVTGCWDGTVQLWELIEGRRVGVVGRHENLVLCVAVSLDGRLAISGSGGSFVDGTYRRRDDDTARVWDLVTGREVFRFTGDGDSVFGVAFTPDGRRALVGSGSVAVWDLRSGTEVHRYPGSGTVVRAVACAWDSRRVLSGDAVGRVVLWGLPA